MRLLQRSLLMQACVALIVLTVAAVAVFLALRQMIESEIDEQLTDRVEGVFAHLVANEDPGDPSVRISQAEHRRPGSAFSDVFITGISDDGPEPYRELRVVREVNGRMLALVLRTSRLEWEDFSETIFTVFLVAAALLVFGGFVSTALMSRSLWRPFFQNLEKLRQFSVRQNQPVEWTPSGIHEFSQLSASLASLTERVRDEYRVLREFTDNASHEMQTPLSIIRTKLDGMRQHPALDGELAESLEGAAAAADRLSRLNRSLILLAGLEAGHYDVSRFVDISRLVMTQTAMMNELFLERGLRLDTRIEQGVSSPGNAYLIEILITNLLSNTIRYSSGDPTVRLELNHGTLEVSNAGSPLEQPFEELCKRFVKGRADSGTAGLGLAIVHEITLRHGWSLEYSYEEGRHVFLVRFRL